MTIEVIERFPPNLLSSSLEDRLRYFEQVIILHPHLTETLAKTLDVIAQSNASFVMRVYGASGVGKSLLISLIEQNLIEQWHARDDRNPGHVPLVSILARSPESGHFDLDHYHKQILTALHEPLINYKIEPGVRTKRQRVTSGALQHSTIQVLKYRQPIAVLVDDGHYLLKAASSQYVEEVSQTIHGAAHSAKVRHLLFGTFDLLDFLDKNEVSANGKNYIHFRRYRLDSDNDVATFLRILLTFQRHLPLVQEPDLVGLYKHLYVGCLGCVGLLKSLLYRTLAATLAHNELTITWEVLQEHMETQYNLARLSQEIAEGERRCLAIDDRTEHNVKLPEASRSAQSKAKQQPGKRLPIRDKTKI